MNDFMMAYRVDTFGRELAAVARQWAAENGQEIESHATGVMLTVESPIQDMEMSFDISNPDSDQRADIIFDSASAEAFLIAMEMAEENQDEPELPWQLFAGARDGRLLNTSLCGWDEGNMPSGEPAALAEHFDFIKRNPLKPGRNRALLCHVMRLEKLLQELLAYAPNTERNTLEFVWRGRLPAVRLSFTYEGVPGVEKTWSTGRPGETQPLEKIRTEYKRLAKAFD